MSLHRDCATAVGAAAAGSETSRGAAMSAGVKDGLSGVAAVLRRWGPRPRGGRVGGDK